MYTKKSLVLVMLMLLFSVVACKTNPTDQETDIPVPVTLTQTTVQDVVPPTATVPPQETVVTATTTQEEPTAALAQSTPLPDVEPPFGTWIVDSFVFGRVSAWGEIEANQLLGKLASLQSEKITFNGNSCLLLELSSEFMEPAIYLETQYKMTPAALGLSTTNFEVIQSSCDLPAFHEFVRIHDESGAPTLMINLNGVFFFLKPAPLAADAGRQRIQFEPGTTSASIEGGTVGATRAEYVLGAAQGQWMTVQVTSLEENAGFSIYTPDGQIMDGTQEEVTGWQGELFTSGDYLIIVGSTGGNTSYTLNVEITDDVSDTPATLPANVGGITDTSVRIVQEEGSGTACSADATYFVHVDITSNGPTTAFYRINATDGSGQVADGVFDGYASPEVQGSLTFTVAETQSVSLRLIGPYPYPDTITIRVQVNGGEWLNTTVDCT